MLYSTQWFTAKLMRCSRSFVDIKCEDRPRF